MSIQKTGQSGPAIQGSSASFSLGARTWTAGTLYILQVVQTKSSSPTPNIPSISGNTGVTWDLIATQTYNTIATPLSRVSVFRACPTATVTNTTIINNTNGNATTGYYLSFFTGMPTINNGANAIRQYATNVDDSAANPNVTLATLNGDLNSCVFGFFGTNTTFGGTIESGWTDAADLSFTNVGMRAWYKIGGSDNTIQLTRTGGTPWGGIGIEIINYRQFINIT
jgi:hypothetical protein